MLTKEDARQIALDQIQVVYPNDPYDIRNLDLVIVDDLTIERSWGWVFF